MAPALAVPQYANDTTNKSSEFNMESALDFDLLAEYLLEDVGAGGFDFSADVISPSIDATKPQQQQVSAVPQDPGVVTPNGSTSFVDPLADMAALQQPQQAIAPPAQPLPNNGDLAGELSQVQQMIATTQQQAAVAPPVAAVARPPVAPPQAAVPLQTQPQQLKPLAQPTVPLNMMAAAPARQPVQQKPPVARAPVPTIQRPPVAAAMQKPLPRQQPPPKRQRVTAAPPNAKGPGYSFAAANGQVMGTIPTRMPNAAGAIPAHTATAAAAGGGRQKSQAQIDRRRERNRILARRTRLRKKFFFESLQKDVADLQRENAALKSIVRSRLKPDDARAILTQCNANQNLPGQSGEAALASAGSGAAAAAAAEAQGAKKLDREDFSLIQSIQNSQQCFIITDPSLHDNPIVYASDDFLTLTGYSQEEVLGRNCRFLQGTETCQAKVAQVRKAVSVGEDVNVTFVNYTSDGKPFWNSLFIAALRDADNNIVNFIGVIVKVAGPEPGDSEYGKVLK